LIPTVNITVTATGGVGPYTGTGTFSEGAGSYNYTITDANGCSASTTVIVASAPDAPQITIESTTTELNCNTSFIELIATSSLSNYTWSVSGPAGTPCPGTPNPDLICSAFFDPVCGCDGVEYSNPCYAELYGGVLYYLPGACGSTDGLPSITVSNPGVYTVTVTDANGCSATDEIVITEDLTAPTADVVAAGDICSNENASFSISGTAGDVVTYTINSGASQTVTIGASGNEAVSVPSPTTDVTLTLLQVERGNCVQVLSASASVDVTSAPTANAGTDVETCQDETIIIDAQAFAGATYAWEGPGGFQSSDLNPVITNATTADNGEYYFIVGVGICIDIDTVNVTVGPTYVTEMPSIAICNDVPYEFIEGIIITNDTTITMEYQTEVTGCDSSVVWTFIELDEIVVEPTVIELCPGASHSFPNGTTANTSGLYEFEYTSLTGCDSIVSYLIEVSEPIVTNVQVPPLCYGEEIDLGNGVIADESGLFTVVFDAANSCDSTVNYSVAILPELQSEFADFACQGDGYALPDGQVVFTTDEYEVELTGQFGCDSLVRVLLTFVPQVSVSIIPESDSLEVCQGDTLMLIADGAGNYAWSSDVGGLLSTEGMAVEISPVDDAWVVLTGSNQACSARDSIYFTVNPLPQLEIEAPDAICIGDSVAISGSGAEDLLWLPNDFISCDDCADIVVSPSESTVFTLTGSNGQCFGSTSFTMEVQAVPVASVFGDTLVCANSPAQLYAAGGESYTWSTGQTGSSISVEPLETTVYQLVVLSGICYDTTYITVEAIPLPDVNTNNDTTITLGGQVQLIATGGEEYSWSPATDLSCSTCFNPIAIPSETTVYCVEAISDRGCADTACVKIEVTDECETFFIPNAFAPERGGHEMNDCFRPFGEECFASMRLRVFDRWGELVFESSSFEDCWDGNYQGKKVNSGVFVYYFDGVLINGEPFFRKGNVTVIR
jgi:gliding motility-associated-like protein